MIGKFLKMVRDEVREEKDAQELDFSVDEAEKMVASLDESIR